MVEIKHVSFILSCPPPLRPSLSSLFSLCIFFLLTFYLISIPTLRLLPIPPLSTPRFLSSFNLFLLCHFTSFHPLPPRFVICRMFYIFLCWVFLHISHLGIIMKPYLKHRCETACGQCASIVPCFLRGVDRGYLERNPAPFSSQVCFCPVELTAVLKHNTEGDSLFFSQGVFLSSNNLHQHDF